MKLLRLIASALGVRDSKGLQPMSPGGATDALLGSITRVVLTAVTVWQLVMVAVTLAVPGAGSWFLALAQALIAAFALVSRRDRRSWPFLAVAMVVAGVWGYLVSGDINSALTFAACWQINFSSFVAGLLILRRYAVLMVVGSAAVASSMILVFLPEWGVQFPLSVIVTQTTIVLAIRLGMAALLRSAAAADLAVADADAAALRNESLAHRGARIAEEARVLHDTAINTFAAIASGGTATQPLSRVREQCARDVKQIEQLRGTQLSESDVSIWEIFDQPRLPVRRHGADDADIERIGRSLRADVVRAVVGCVREAVNNASKHSGADHVDLEVVVEGNEFVVRVSDGGSGFDPGTAEKRGLAASIERRAHEHGIVVDVRSTPGAGTTITLRVPLEGTVPAAPTRIDDGALSAAAGTARRRAGTYWGFGVTAESIILTLAGGTNEGQALLPMILIMALSLLVAMTPALRRNPLAPPALIIMTVLVFALSARATAFGAVGPIHWQALAAAGPFVLLLSVTDSRVWRHIGAAAWGAAIIVIALSEAPVSATAVIIVGIAGLAGLGFSAVWALFQGLMSKLSQLAADARRLTFETRLRGEREAAAQASYQRWAHAGLDAANELLRGIRDGSLDPGSEATRLFCDREERYLRQLVLISPELVHLGSAFMPLLRQAREAEVRLTLRLGDQDTADAAIAASIAEVVSLNIAAAGRGGKLSATLFPVADGLQLTVAGAGLRFPEHLAGAGELLSLGETELLELGFGAVTSVQEEVSGTRAAAHAGTGAMAVRRPQ